MTFKYIAVPAGTSECPIPCRVHITQRVEQMWAACPCPRLTRALRPSGAEGEAGARRPPAGPPPEHPLLGAAGRGRAARAARPPGCSGGAFASWAAAAAAGAGGARPGEGESPWRAGGAASAALLSSPAEGAPGSRPGRRSPRILADLRPCLSPSVEAASAGSCGAQTPRTEARGCARRVRGRRPERGERAGLRCSGRERRRRP